MKKTLSLLLALLMVFSFAACKDGSEDDGEKQFITVTEYSIKNDVTAESMASAIAKQYGFSMPMDVSDKTLESLFHIPPSAVEEYAGVFSISMSSADNVLVVKPFKGKETVVNHGFEQRRQDVMDTFTGYLQASYDQAEKSFVLERDGYYIFLCVNEEEAVVTQYVETTFFDITEKQVEVDAGMNPVQGDDTQTSDGGETDPSQTSDDAGVTDGADVTDGTTDDTQAE